MSSDQVCVTVRSFVNEGKVLSVLERPWQA